MWQTNTWVKILLFSSISLLISGLVLIGTKIIEQKSQIVSPVSIVEKLSKKPLEKYSFESLKTDKSLNGSIFLLNTLSETDYFSSKLFSLEFNDASISGIINIPKIKKPLGTIILLRGYVDREIYESGIGTKRIGEKLAQSGFITMAPDFLGYGLSSMPSVNPMEERFQTYPTVITLINSLSGPIGLFGHSNGGHITLAVLEITGLPLPTVLWAPVSKPFPYSILYYTDEFDDKGKALRKLIADFEKDYDVTKYSLDNHLDWIIAPLSIHQGLADQEVPYWWSDELVNNLNDKNKKVEYYKYPGENHNFNSAGLWETMANRTVNFYVREFSKL